MRSAPVALADIVAALRERIEPLARELIPNLMREGRELRAGDLAGGPGRSLCIWIDGAKKGEWWEYCDGVGGDPLHLIAHVRHGGAIGPAVADARKFLGMDAMSPARLAQYRAADAARRVSDLQERERKRAQAFAIYMKSQPNIVGTAAADYLAGRAMDVSSLARSLGALRYNPALWNVETQRKWPALVAAIAQGDVPVVAVHRTWLQIHPDGRVTKAPLRDAKRTLGSYAGGAIHLWRGATGKTQVQPGEWLLLSEGIEDGLSGVIACPEYRTWCAVSLSNMAGLQLPDALEGVTILCQNDTQPQAIKSLDRAVCNFQKQGKRVRLARMPPEVKDANDVLRLDAGGNDAG